jgi:hypothetical protein
MTVNTIAPTSSNRANIVSQPSSKEFRDHQADLGRHISIAATTAAVQMARILIAKRYAEVTW